MLLRITNFLRKLLLFISNSELWIQDSNKYAFQLMLSQRSINSENMPLFRLGFKVYSQWEEDGILFYLSEKILTAKPRILELGAGNFIESNSRFLCEYMNASAFLVDARQDLNFGIDKSGLRWKTHIEGLIDWISCENAKRIQKQALDFLGKIDILSIDLDGQDYWILKEIDLSGVSIIVVEYNPIFGSKSCVTVMKNHTFSRNKSNFNLIWGASLRAFIEYLDSKGFVFAGSNMVGNNAFFVKSIYVEILSIEMPNVSDLIRETDYLVRESVDENGNLSYMTGKEARQKLRDELVFDISSGKEVLFSQIAT